ncbi:LPS export ABC transporter permease LptF [Thiohalobacter sp. IOR34]|uniref:LPS export ABC transporter permease LptF n=1 Tax=Thiohalobacter sp. IOR34 TaxID=3057176 RepID=UPI0025B0AB83|nr:LPS export ABC transporter permease LptF [Thiohalobacter sp. IOR34]WJW74914.1 LPS export ABC transporter permease LptF [Thiohalobacter sp. IOR34]
MLRILDRYLLREVMKNWLAVLLVLWAIVLANRFARYLGEAASGDIPAAVIFTLLGLKSVSYLTPLLPLALFLGALLALGRLYRDSEMVAMHACGVGPRELYRPLLGLAAVLAVALLGLSLFVAPRTAELGYQLRAEAERGSDIGTVSAGRFQEAQEGRLIFYAEGVSRDRRFLERLFVRDLKGVPPTLLTARRAYPQREQDSGDRFLVMEDGFRYQGMPGDPRFRVIRFQRHGIRIETAAPAPVITKRDAIPSRRLLASADTEDIAELQWRLSLPLAVLVLMVLVLPLSHSTPRQGRYGRLFLAILVFIIYYNLLSTARVWVGRGLLPPLPGLWWVHLLPLLLAGFLWWRLRPRPRRGAA